MAKLPFLILATNECNGESLELNGTINILVEQNNTPSGNFHVTVHSNIHGQGVGSQGNEYVFNETSNDHFSTNNRQFENTFNVPIRVISKGTAPNFLVHALIHLTVNANGDVTATISVFKTECRG
ncbi:hypothetical protein BACCIP111895_01860 [Neobacillus rhizosphaerae]|uniref:Uncharacterized protein n=1 Tax=Neobacillus rhizosphaerae TaxID=2880965 RepID=A0ABN8KME5_9BACI|nr:hypothetical protein [Neobacillus rhizosphaerae]CAH2714684.1 hypothetical protein BACCIP111895_01860 [Neobacillus rhizosphaerae]